MKIVLVGDSTVATGGGWVDRDSAPYMTPNVTCLDVSAEWAELEKLSRRGRVGKGAGAAWGLLPDSVWA